MRATWTIARRELKALFDQPTGYILLVVFTGVNGFLSFRQIELYGVASLRPMLDFLPWVLLFLVPAVTMRALAEDTVDHLRRRIGGAPAAGGAFGAQDNQRGTGGTAAVTRRV